MARKETIPKHAHADSARESGRPVGFAIITVSDTRTRETDASGKLAAEIVGGAGHAVKRYEIVKDEKHQIREAVNSAIVDESVNIIFLTGGTGISPRDTTAEALADLYDKALPGFGELFRSLSFAEIGTATILSRASAGVTQGKAIFSAPGSRAAVKLALEKIIIPEAAHIVNELHKTG
ncbi:MAG: MogA/MoaB family molybdenum cofactor biosynthesis protein [Planctomycetes bacterium]|nr:MogA/MoaB family molybdenum cofactor biosynthesis protein [Planctomycetota bacterium]